MTFSARRRKRRPRWRLSAPNALTVLSPRTARSLGTGTEIMDGEALVESSPVGTEFGAVVAIDG